MHRELFETIASLRASLGLFCPLSPPRQLNMTSAGDFAILLEVALQEQIEDGNTGLKKATSQIH
jgi:hypothetical protein